MVLLVLHSSNKLNPLQISVVLLNNPKFCVQSREQPTYDICSNVVELVEQAIMKHLEWG